MQIHALLHAIELLFVKSNGGVVVEALLSQHLGQLALVASRLLQLGTLVLEPDLDLSLVEPQLRGQALPALLVEIAVGIKLLLEPAQLFGGEGSAWPLLVIGGERLGLRGTLLHFACAGTCERKGKNQQP